MGKGFDAKPNSYLATLSLRFWNAHRQDASIGRTWKRSNAEGGKGVDNVSLRG